MNSLKKKKAQQVVEFLLVAPLLMVFLGIMTEYAYALNINMTFTKGLKTVTAEIYREISPSMTASDIEANVKTNLTNYLAKNNVPIKSENNIKVGSMESGSTVIFMATYRYFPAFTLPNIWFKFLPDEFDFFATNAVPAAFLGGNNYDSTDSLKLDRIWSSTTSFSKEDAFNASKKGIMKSPAGRKNILFLVKTTATDLTTPYALVDWAGNIKSNSGKPFVIDMDNGKFYTCSTTCSLYGESFFNYIIGKFYYNLFVVPPTFISDSSIISSVWLSPVQEDISDTSVSGVLKNVLSISEGNFSLGNYDNIKVSTYNADVSTTNSFTMKAYGSFILIYPSGINPANIGASVISKDDYF